MQMLVSSEFSEGDPKESPEIQRPARRTSKAGTAGRVKSRYQAPVRTEGQQLAFDAAVHQMRDATLRTFATIVAALVRRGLCLEIGVREGRSVRETARIVGCTTTELRELQEIAEDYGDLDEETIYRAAVWAHLTDSLPLQIVDLALNHRRWMLRVLGRAAPFIRAAGYWKSQQDEGKLPPLPFVEYFLSGDLGAVIDDETKPAIAHHLADALDEECYPGSLAEQVIDAHKSEQLTPRLVTQIAREAIELAERRLQEAAADPGEPPGSAEPSSTSSP